MVTEGVFTPAHVLAGAILRREVSSLEVVEAYLAQSVASKEHDSLEAYLMTWDRRDDVMRAWNEFFTDWDVLIMPAGTRTAELHGEELAEPQEYPYALSAVSGCPMVVIPAGVDKQGLPFGLQILARRWDDERLLAIAESLSELTGGFRRPPGY
jgi:amidase